MRMIRTTLIAIVASVTLLAATTAAPAANNKVPTAPTSQGMFEGGAPISDGTTAQIGEIAGRFEKGTETYNSSSTTTVVDFTLPHGVTIRTDADLCDFLPNNLCLFILDSTCADPTGITASGNQVEFQIACDPGESFVWIALVDSLLPEANYNVNIQFKVGTYRRSQPGPNMWQIQMPGAFEVPGGGCIGTC